MNAKEIIKYIGESEKKTPVKVTIKNAGNLTMDGCKIFDCGDTKVVFGDWKIIEPALKEFDEINYVIENNCRNSAIPMVDMKQFNARIEPGAIIRDQVEIGNNAVIMMGAIINIGSVIGDGTMIDMGVVMGGRATVGKNCHIGAGTVLAGVIEPPNADPVVVEDNVVIGANVVVLEGVRIRQGAIVAAGAVVVSDVPENVVVGGIPAKVLKEKDEKTETKTELVEALRQL